jgi:hypothetical protein
VGSWGGRGGGGGDRVRAPDGGNERAARRARRGAHGGRASHRSAAQPTGSTSSRASVPAAAPGLAQGRSAGQGRLAVVALEQQRLAVLGGDRAEDVVRGRQRGPDRPRAAPAGRRWPPPAATRGRRGGSAAASGSRPRPARRTRGPRWRAPRSRGGPGRGWGPRRCPAGAAASVDGPAGDRDGEAQRVLRRVQRRAGERVVEVREDHGPDRARGRVEHRPAGHHEHGRRWRRRLGVALEDRDRCLEPTRELGGEPRRPGGERHDLACRGRPGRAGPRGPASRSPSRTGRRGPSSGTTRTSGTGGARRRRGTPAHALAAAAGEHDPVAPRRRRLPQRPHGLPRQPRPGGTRLVGDHLDVGSCLALGGPVGDDGVRRRSRSRRHAAALGTVPTASPTPPARRARSRTTSRAWCRGLRRSLSAGLASSRTTARPSRSSGTQAAPRSPTTTRATPQRASSHRRYCTRGEGPPRRSTARSPAAATTASPTGEAGSGTTSSTSRPPARQRWDSSASRAATSSPGSGRHRNEPVPVRDGVEQRPPPVP